MQFASAPADALRSRGALGEHAATAARAPASPTSCRELGCRQGLNTIPNSPLADERPNARLLLRDEFINRTLNRSRIAAPFPG